MITQCTPFTEIVGLLPWETAVLYACDIWNVPHVITVFLWAIMSKSPLVAFLLSGVFEIVEALALMGFGDFGFFFSGPKENIMIENIGQSLVIDWLLHGGIGTLLGWMYLKTFRFPAMITVYDFWNKPFYFFYYLLAYIFSTLLYFFLYGIKLENGFPLGILMGFIGQGIVILLILWTQPRNRWKDYTKAERTRFWLIQYLFAVGLGVSNMFDWLYSSAIQVWVICGIFFLMLIVLECTKMRKYRWWNHYYVE